ncbi:helix-turn-helix protein [Curtobacterium sp. PhB172]|nr:helix-turn-helix protein [Curtobacterium sp. PhB172]
MGRFEFTSSEREARTFHVEHCQARIMRSRNPEPLWRDVVGQELRGRRRGRGDTLHDVARRAGVSPQYLSEMERGRKDPSSEMLAAVAGALESSLLDLTAAAAEQLRERARSAGTGGEQVRSAFVLAA